jgi:hypothetical protein
MCSIQFIHAKESLLSCAMIDPVYILDDGKKVPYVPIEIKTHRDAYAATLHVLFKHVADFHICIVKAFSNKYGIPEDDIMQTIQESEEFKNMHVDPALDPITSDVLGYLAQQPAPAMEPAPAVPAMEPAPAVPAMEPAPAAPAVPAMEPAPAVPAVPAMEPAPAVPAIEQDPAPTVIKKRIIKKKTAASSDVIVAMPTVPASTVPASTVPASTVPASTVPTVPIPNEKKKVIRKKFNNEPVNNEPVNNEPVNNERNDVIASVSQVAIAQLLTSEPPTTQKKIIRKK